MLEKNNQLFYKAKVRVMLGAKYMYYMRSLQGFSEIKSGVFQ